MKSVFGDERKKELDLIPPPQGGRRARASEVAGIKEIKRELIGDGIERECNYQLYFMLCGIASQLTPCVRELTGMEVGRVRRRLWPLRGKLFSTELRIISKRKKTALAVLLC